MQDQKSLMFSECSYSWLGMERIAFTFAIKGGQYLIYKCLQPIATQITQDARYTINDAPLMPISRMWQGAGLSFLIINSANIFKKRQ
jgi:hypothetical protein